MNASNNYCDESTETVDNSDKTFEYVVKRSSSSQSYRDAPAPVEQLYKTFFSPEDINGYGIDRFNDNVLFGRKSAPM